MRWRPVPVLGEPRLAALRAVLAVTTDGRSLGSALPEAVAGVADERDRALAQALAYGVLRHRRRLAALRTGLLQRPLRARDADVAGIIDLGLYQLTDTDIPPHAAVAETVGLCQRLRKAWAVKLVNAVLRRFQRESAERLAAADATPAVRESCPDWLADALHVAWPEDWERLLAAQNARAPLTLRVNARRTTREAAAAALGAAGVAARPVAGVDTALTLAEAVPVSRLPGFAEGHLSVQDAAAQLAAPLLAPGPGDRVLDACAAPGGKTAHLLEAADVDVVALDREPGRLPRLEENLQRLGLGAAVVAGDAGSPQAWWDGRAFQRILLDAPCSGTGVIRRHPDIKWLRRAGDIPRLQREQGRLLQALWPLLAPGGRLVYATCSILPAENEAVVAAFVAGRDDVAREAATLPVGRPVGYGHQILTGEADMDGFYYACLRKC